MNLKLAYEQSREDVLFTAFLASKDPAIYLDSLRDAVEAMTQAWDDYKANELEGGNAEPRFAN